MHLQPMEVHGGSRDPPEAPGEPLLKQTPGRNNGPGRGAHSRSRFSGRNSRLWERPPLEHFVKECVPLEGPHAGAWEECQN